jgi:hypothetical protein
VKAQAVIFLFGERIFMFLKRKQLNAYILNIMPSLSIGSPPMFIPDVFKKSSTSSCDRPLTDTSVLNMARRIRV